MIDDGNEILKKKNKTNLDNQENSPFITTEQNFNNSSIPTNDSLIITKNNNNNNFGHIIQDYFGKNTPSDRYF